MNKIFLYGSLIIAAACYSSCIEKPVPQQPLTTIDYVTVGKMMDTIKPPYVIDLENGEKRLILIGCDHNNDTAHPQYKVIEQCFAALQPELAFNEGGQVADSIRFASVQEAVSNYGETGYLKYLCDKAGIRMMNGDINDSLEFSITLQRHPHDQLLLYYLMERLVIPYMYGAYGNRPFEELYIEAIQNWFAKSGFPVPENLKTPEGFKQLYQQYTGNPFTLKITLDIEKFDYVNGGDCMFCAIGRTSKMVRDSVLLHKIDQSLNTHNRVIVTFGYGHALAVEPALKQLIDKRRE